MPSATRSEYITWGDVRRKNVMYNADYSPSSSLQAESPVGSSKAFTVQIKSTTSLPSCLTTCSASAGLGVQASDVQADHCYIDRHCYKAGDSSPYIRHECMTCNPTASATAPTEWTAPDTTSMTTHCLIDGKCIKKDESGKSPDGTTMWGTPKFKDDPCSKCIPSLDATGYSTIAGGCMVSTQAYN